MAKLPPYVFRRPNGSYRYKRNVPNKLRPLIGKDTLYRQLGDSYAEAMQNLPKVHEGGIPTHIAMDLAAQAQGFRNQAHYWAWLRVYVERKRLG